MYFAGEALHQRIALLPADGDVEAPAFDLVGTLSAVAKAASGDDGGWLPEAAELLADAQAAGDGDAAAAALHARARQDGEDVGDHPPITPVVGKVATRKACGDAAGWALYKFVCKSFVASLSADCIFERAEASLTVGAAADALTLSVARCVERGWTEPLGEPVYGGDEAAAAERAGGGVCCRAWRAGGHAAASSRRRRRCWAIPSRRRT